MSPSRAVGLNHTPYGIVLIGQNPLLRKRIAFVLRIAGFRIAASVPDADLALLRAVSREHQIVSILEVNNSFEKTSPQLKHFRTLYSMGAVALVATNLPRASRWFRVREVVKRRHLTPEKGRQSVRVGKGADGISDNAESWGSETPAASAGKYRPTARQAMILKSLMNGDSNKVVARKLRITEETVKVHIKHLLRRIGVKNRTQAAIWALTNNFTPAPASETGNLRLAHSSRSLGPLCYAPRRTGNLEPRQDHSPADRAAEKDGKNIRKHKVVKYHEKRKYY